MTWLLLSTLTLWHPDLVHVIPIPWDSFLLLFTRWEGPSCLPGLSSGAIFSAHSNLSPRSLLCSRGTLDRIQTEHPTLPVFICVFISLGELSKTFQSSVYCLFISMSLEPSLCPRVGLVPKEPLCCWVFLLGSLSGCMIPITPQVLPRLWWWYRVCCSLSGEDVGLSYLHKRDQTLGIGSHSSSRGGNQHVKVFICLEKV